MSNTGKKLKNFLKNKACNPKNVMYSLRNNTNLGGFHLVDINVNANGPLKLVPKKNKNPTIKPGLGRLGKGAEGIAYIGCIDDKCEKMIAIKASRPGSLNIEYDILKKLFKLSNNTPEPYLYTPCETADLLYSEYVSGGDFLSVLQKYEDKIQPIHIKTIVSQVLIALQQIQKVYPSFRHNDLHLGNILLDVNFKKAGFINHNSFKVPNIGLRAVINDFGFSNMEEVPNPKVVSREYIATDGIAPKSNRLYDIHFFLVAMYVQTKRIPKFAEFNNFITSIFTPEYLQENSPKINHYRLRYHADHSFLPSLVQILMSPYFSAFKPLLRATNRRNFVAPIAIRRVVPRPLVQAQTNMKTAANLKNVMNRMFFRAPVAKVKTPVVAAKANSPAKIAVKLLLNKRKVKTPVAVAVAAAATVTNDYCGTRVNPRGVGPQKLTTKQMYEIVRDAGHKGMSQATRAELCALIKLHNLYKSPIAGAAAPKRAATAVAKVKPVAAAAAPIQIRKFLAAQNVNIVGREKREVVVPFLSEKKLWNLHRKKLQNQIYETLNKNKGEYENRMNEALRKADVEIRIQKDHGNAPPAYVMKK